MTQARLIASRKTPIQRIDLEAVDGGDIALYLDRCIQFVSGQDDAAYHGALADLPLSLLGGKPVRALILGGGDGLAARNLLRHRNVRGVTLVEIDGGMIDFCRRHPAIRRLNERSLEDPRLEVVVGDARDFVAGRKPRAAYDLAVIDFPDPEERFLDLFRWPFYRQVLGLMNRSRAVVAVQASTAGSPVEIAVGQHLSKAMGRPVGAARFRGRCMEDGAIVIGDTAGRWPRPLPPLTIASMSE